MKKGFAFFAFLSMSVLCLIWGGVLTSCKHSGSSGPASLDLTMYSDSKNKDEIDSLSYTVGEDVPKFYIQSLNYPNKDQIELDEASYTLGNDEEELDPDEDVTVAYKKSQKNYKITLNNPPQQPGSYDFMLLFSATNGEECELEFTLKVSRKGDNGETIEGAAPVITKDVEGGVDPVSVKLTVEASVPGDDNAKITYQWYKNRSRIDGATTSSYEANKDGAYYVKVTANDQDVYSKTVNVVIGSAADVKIPIITIVAQEPYKIENGTLIVPEVSKGVLSVEVENDVKLDSYTWYKAGETSGNDEPVPNGNTAMYTPADFAKYYCTVYVAGKEYESSAVNVIEEDIRITRNETFGESVYLSEGLMVNPTTNVPCTFAYQWYEIPDETSGNSEILTGETRAIYIPTREGFFECKITATSKKTGNKKTSTTPKVEVRRQEVIGPVGPTSGNANGSFDFN
ncbi:MAG: hypothetical protein K2M50_00220 [Treponemataceae bacterium]|nr:hypothetical protein [Treponemataceae bacterium]